jgi:uncharacterized repeat protein (TIGR01451 family)
MGRITGFCSNFPVRINAGFVLAMLFVVPQVCTSGTLSLTKEGPETAYEGDLIEYRLETVNTGVTVIEAAEILETLPASVEFVAATPTQGGSYDPVSGIWTLPNLGISENDNTAGLHIEALVKANLIPDPTGYVTARNAAEVILPAFPETVKAEVSTNIVCAFCIDWEIVSVKLGSDHRVEPPDPFESRFFLYVQVANNGPVASEATLGVTYFTISGGGFGSVALTPALPVPVSLDAGEIKTITFSTDWEEGPDSDYTISWAFEVSDVTLMDPVMPNTVAGSWSGNVEGGGGGGGCSLYEREAAIDPFWMLFLVFSGFRLIRNKM